MNIDRRKMPDRIRNLPVDPSRGNIPVPWFVAWVDGKPEFRAASALKRQLAVREHRCWVCGEALGRNFTFVIGPMCTVNRISAEPPSHDGCAEFSARFCPFLSRPRMDRRTNGLPEACVKAPGVAIQRNPGVTCLWGTRKYRLVREGDGVLFRIGDPQRVRWFAEGRPATREEVLASIDSGLPILEEMAGKQGRDAQLLLDQMYRASLRFLPEVIAS